MITNKKINKINKDPNVYIPKNLEPLIIIIVVVCSDQRFKQFFLAPKITLSLPLLLPTQTKTNGEEDTSDDDGSKKSQPFITLHLSIMDPKN